MSEIDPSEIRLVLVETTEEVWDFMQWLTRYERTEKPLAIDVETSGLAWWSDEIRMFQIGGVDAGFAFRWDRWSGVLADVVRRWPNGWVGHNVLFDSQFIQHQGIQLPWPRMHDTLTLAHMDCSFHRVGLKEVSQRLLGDHAVAGQSQLKKYMKAQKWDWADVPHELGAYWHYACIDVILTAHLFDILHPKAHKELYATEMECLAGIALTEQTGLRVDIPYVEQQKAELEAWVEQEPMKWQDETGIQNLTANQQIAEYLVGQGWTPTVFTKTGKVKMDKDIIEELSIDWPVARAHGEVKSAQKVISGYFGNILKWADSDGIVHPNFKPLSAVTGRFGVTNPAVQTQPRTKAVRRSYIPREGNKLVAVDFNNMEVRAIGSLAHEQSIIDAVAAGVDLHRRTASLAYGRPEVDIHKDERSVAKNGLFSKLYGAGTKKFAATAKITVAEAESIYEALNQTYPTIRRYGYWLQDQAIDSPEKAMWGTPLRYIIDPYGRKHWVQRGDEYKFINYITQGSCATVMKQALNRCHRAGVGEYIVNVVHDEIIADVPENLAEEVKHEIEKQMYDDSWTIPLDAEGDILSHWGELYS